MAGGRRMPEAYSVTLPATCLGVPPRFLAVSRQAEAEELGIARANSISNAHQMQPHRLGRALGVVPAHGIDNRQVLR